MNEVFDPIKTLREVFAWHDALPQAEKDKITADAKRIADEAAKDAAITIAICNRLASPWYRPFPKRFPAPPRPRQSKTKP